MNRTQLAEAVAKATGLTTRQADEALGVALDAIKAQVAAGAEVALPGFGTFQPRPRAARAGRNPQTGEPIEIAASVAPAFKAATAFRRLVAGG